MNPYQGRLISRIARVPSRYGSSAHSMLDNSPLHKRKRAQTHTGKTIPMGPLERQASPMKTADIG